jgi:predicted nucleic acid-binding Zn finger protein
MLTLSSAGAGYRTKLMDRPTADRFAACLQANPRFTDVAVCESGRTQNPEVRWFVAYAPASETRQAALASSEQHKRLQTSLEEGSSYVFCLDQDGARPFFYCLNPRSGEVYEVTERTCTCPDFHYRCRHAGLHCKHQLALLNGLGQAASF